MTTRLLIGDAREQLARLPERHIHTCVTSPPYFGLRSYGTEPVWWDHDAECQHEPVHMPIGKPKDETTAGTKQKSNAGSVNGTGQHDSWTCAKCGGWLGHLGLEPTVARFIDHLVIIFRAVWRVLRDDGTLWVNLGDSYAGSGGFFPDAPSNLAGSKQRTNRGSTRAQRSGGDFRPKELMMVPARMAIALQDDGWYLRSDIIWAKKSPMPESVVDRPTQSHEHIFLLSKKPKYFYDGFAVREEAVKGSAGAGARNYEPALGENGNHRARKAQTEQAQADGRNMRNVWTLGPDNYPGSHFATYPREIPRRAISAGTSERGCCPTCGASWIREVEKAIDESRPVTRPDGVLMPNVNKAGQTTNGNSSTTFGHFMTYRTVGWKPGCECLEAEPVPCRVLDPFVGSGTTMLVCTELGRDGIGIDLNPASANQMPDRINSKMPLFAQIEVD